MKTLADLFLFIAYELEGKGYDSEDIETIYGITKKYHPKIFATLQSDLKSHKNKDEAVINAYSKMFGEMLYAKDIYLKENISFEIFANYFDFAFNAGEKNAAKILQETVNKNISGENSQLVNVKPLKVDGIIGKHTIKALEELYLFHYELSCIYFLLRRKWYMNGKKRYRCGWINRTLKLEEYLHYD